jgi:hypothetical protein
MINYRFYINPSLVELQPIYNNCTIKRIRNGNIIDQVKIDGNLKFNGTDYSALKTLSLTQNYQDIWIDEIIAGVTTRFTARLRFEGKWNSYSKQCELKVETTDKYDKLFNNKDINIKSQFPVYDSTTIVHNIHIEGKTNDHLPHSIDIVEWLTKCFNSIDASILIDASSFPFIASLQLPFSYLNICPLSSYVDFDSSSIWHKDTELRLELQKVLDYILFFLGYDWYLNDTNYLRFVRYPNYFGVATQNLTAYERDEFFNLNEFTHTKKIVSCAGESLSNDFKPTNYRYELSGEPILKSQNTEFILDFKAIKANDTLVTNPNLIKSGLFLANTQVALVAYPLTAVAPAQTETNIKAPDAYNLTGVHCWFERTSPDSKIYCGVQWTYSLREGEKIKVSILNITNTSGANVRLQIVDDLNPATILAQTLIASGNSSVEWIFAGNNIQYSGAANIFFRVLMEGTPTGRVEFDVEYIYNYYRELKKLNSAPYYENNLNGGLALSHSYDNFFDEPITDPWMNDLVKITSPANSVLPRKQININKPIISGILDHKFNEFVITSFSNSCILQSVNRNMASGKESIEIVFP